MNGSVIKQRREKVGLTQLKLANRLGVDRSTVAKWEAGDIDPRASLLPALAKILKCKIEALY